MKQLNWILQIYNSHNKVVEESRIMNRTEHEASKTASSYVSNKWPGKDWSLTILVLNTDIAKAGLSMNENSETILIVKSYDGIPEL